MHVCQVISGDLWAGAEVMVHNLVQGLLQYTDVELSAIFLNEGKLAETVRKSGIPVEIVDETNKTFFQLARNFRELITRLSPDLIHSHRSKENVLAYLSVKKQLKHIPLVSTQHGMPEPLIERKKFMKQYIVSKYNSYLLSNHFDYVVLVSEEMKRKFIHENRISTKNIVVIPNGIDIDFVNTPYVRSTQSGKDYFVIGSAGRLFPIKNYRFMVEVAKEVSKHIDKVRFELAGEGPERENLIRLIREYELEETFTLKGFVDNMHDFYQNIDLYINTSFHEGLPMSVLEAMTHGLPVIAPNTGGLNEVIEHGFTGYVVDKYNPEIFAELCLKLYRESGLRFRMGQASFDKIQRDYSVGKMAMKYRELYRKVLNLEMANL